MKAILEKTVNPSDCTLAIAIPLTREEFLDDLQPESPKDYARHFSAPWGRRSREELWAKYRDNISNLIDLVAEEVDRLGVKVVRNVKLADMPSLLSDRDVVSLVSHWRAAYIEPQDFVSFPLFVERLRTSSDEVIAHLRQMLSDDVAAQLRKLDMNAGAVSAFKSDLIDELNGLLEGENLGGRHGFCNSPTEQPLHVEQRAYLNRITLDSAFEGELKRGNRMEFFDGLQSAEDIREQIPDSFAGLLDLIVCNSVLPAEVIKSLKRNCLIISNQFPANPGFRLLLYKAIIHALHLEPGSFVRTMMEVRQRLGNYLNNHE